MSIHQAETWTIDDVGLQHILELSRKIIGSEIAINVLAKSVEVSEDPSVRDTKEAIRTAIQDGVTIYLTNWSDRSIDAFHMHETPDARGAERSNIFLRVQDVHDFLPQSGSFASWTEEDKLGIITITWWLVHELAHMLGTVLADRGAIITHRTPVGAIAWNQHRYAALVRSSECVDEYTIYGERGFFLESKLGGTINCVIKDRKVNEVWFKTSESCMMTKLSDSDLDALLNLASHAEFDGLKLPDTAQKQVKTKDNFKPRECTEARQCTQALRQRSGRFARRIAIPGIKF